MPKLATPQLTIVRGYWTYRSRQGKTVRTKTFGSAAKVPKAQAEGELQRVLEAEKNGEGERTSSGFLTTFELCRLYIRNAKSIYVSEDGKQTGEARNLMHGLQPLVDIFGTLQAVHLRPRHIKEFCEAQAKGSVSRSTINKRIGYIKRLLVWGKNEELLPPVRGPKDLAAVGACEACSDFPSMRKGRPVREGGTIPRESTRVTSIAAATLQQTLPFMPATVRNMVELQELASMRPAEVCWLDMAEVNIENTPWIYEPSRHKTKHHGKVRRIFFGPKAREILAPFKFRRGSRVFRPKDAKAEAGELDVRAGGDVFSTRSYRDAIWKACDRAFPAPEEIRGAFLELKRFRAKQLLELKRAEKLGEERPKQSPPSKELVKRAREESKWIWAHRWSPNQLRHTGLTEIVDREISKAKERARVVAGHGSQRVTEVYLDKNDELAAEVMEQAG